MKKNIIERINAIEERNRKVELDKAWETSMFRKIVIALLTYLTIVLFFIACKLPDPLINSVVPTLGFIISTLTLSFFKALWIRHLKKIK